MATLFSNALHPSCVNNAVFRVNSQFVEDVFVSTGGWAVTSDTGQTLPSALIAPTTTNQRMGYRIYAMTDALAATQPVVMKVEFGSANVASIYKVYITIGMGSDGAGNITNKLIDSLGVYQGSQGSDPAVAVNSYGSAGPARAAFCLFVNTPNLYNIFFSIERSKNALGVDTGAGLLLLWTSSLAGVAGLDASQYLIYGMTTQPLTEVGLSFILTSQTPSQSFGGSVGVGVISHLKGIAQQPGVNLVTVNVADVPPEGVFLVSIYGVTHTYQQLSQLFADRPMASTIIGGLVNYNDQSCRVAMRYD